MDNPVSKSAGAQPLVLFDADCGFCTASAGWMRGRWFLADVDAVALQRADLTIHNLSVDKCAERLHVIADKDVYIGSDAIARILRASRAPWPLVGRVMAAPGVRWLAQGAYTLVARNRHRLPGGTSSCELPDGP